jgi:ParB family chromosome partitioning protein
MSKIALGRGLGALIPQADNNEASTNAYSSIPLEQIAPNPMQPRVNFSQERLCELADSLKRDGLIQPLAVVKADSGYTIVAGERRYRAAIMAGLKEVPAVVMESMDDTRLLELALVENIQREDLNPVELAEAYRRLINKCGLTQQQLSDRVGKSRAAVANQLRLLGLPEKIKGYIRDGKLTEGHARSILSLTNEPEMLRMAESIMSGSLSVRDVEQQVRKKRGRRLVIKRHAPVMAEAETYLKQLLGTSVRIVPGLKKSRIEIDYFGDDDLDRLYELFRRIER